MGDRQNKDRIIELTQYRRNVTFVHGASVTLHDIIPWDALQERLRSSVPAQLLLRPGSERNAERYLAGHMKAEDNTID
jgi:hypothetical protein